MTKQEILDRFRDINEVYNDSSRYDSLSRMLDELLEEQEAVEPKKESDGNPERWASWWYVCGNCGVEIDCHDMYCRHCGRAVKWD